MDSAASSAGEPMESPFTRATAFVAGAVFLQTLDSVQAWEMCLGSRFWVRLSETWA